MLQALDKLGVKVDKLDKTTVKVHGVAGPLPIPPSQDPNSELKLFLGNAGTAMRPLAAVLPFSSHLLHAKQDLVLDGVERMRERPIADLVGGVAQLGASITCPETGCPPVTIKKQGDANSIGGTANISGKMSSQFLSALLIGGVLSGHDEGVTIKIKDELISAPYVEMTIGLMKKFGVGEYIR